MAKIPCAIIGLGNIGTDVMIKVMRAVMRASAHLEHGRDGRHRLAVRGSCALAGVGVPTTHVGIDGLLKLPNYRDIKVVFDATSAKAHLDNNELM